MNEAARCLGEGIARCADDDDRAMVFGAGFEPFGGGPLRFAQTQGLGTVVDALDRMAVTHPHLAPSDALRRFAAAGSFESESSSVMATHS